METLIRYPYEVHDEKEYFDEIQDVKVTKDMLDLAKHIVNQKAADFEPESFEDHYEEALTELINAKRQGKTVGPRPRPSGGNVVDLMDALKQSLATEPQPKGKKRARLLQARRKCCCRSRGKSPQRRRRPSRSGPKDAEKQGSLGRCGAKLRKSREMKCPTCSADGAACGAGSHLPAERHRSDRLTSACPARLSNIDHRVKENSPGVRPDAPRPAAFRERCGY
jgi:hypothetical protein